MGGNGQVTHSLWILETGLLSRHGRAGCVSRRHVRNPKGVDLLGERERSFHDAPLLFICKHSLPFQGFSTSASISWTQSPLLLLVHYPQHREKRLRFLFIPPEVKPGVRRGWRAVFCPAFFPPGTERNSHISRGSRWASHMTTEFYCAHPGTTAKHL